MYYMHLNIDIWWATFSVELLLVLRKPGNFGWFTGLLQKTLQAAGEELRPRVVAEVDLPPSDDELPRSVSQNVPERSRRETPALISPLVLSAEVEKEVEVDEEGKSEAKSEGKS